MIRGDWQVGSKSARQWCAARWSIPLLGASMLLFAAGCPKSAAPVAPAAGGAGGPTAQQIIDDQCASIVSSIHDTFQLQKLGQTTTVADGVLRLNDWLQSCGPTSTETPAVPDRVRESLSAEQLEAVQSPRFTNRDGEHVRDGVLFRSLARYAFETDEASATELQRVVAAFQYVIRAIELSDKHPEGLPLTPYEIFILGKGTAADRAWLFASLLRQSKFDTVLIVPAGKDGDPANPAGPFLVGVILDGQTYLFDPRAGVPIPAPGATESAKAATGVATLNQAADDPEVLKQLDVDEEHPYGIRASDLKQPTVLLISDLAFSFNRMRDLQGQFSGEYSMVLSDPLQDTTDGPGLWTRIGKAGGDRWSTDSLRLWGYPESQLQPHATFSDNQKETLRLVLSPFEAYSAPALDKQGKPTLVEQEQVDDPAAGAFDPAKGKRVRTTKWAQMRARLKHVGGDFAQAVLEYHEVWQRSRRLVQAAMKGALPMGQDKLILHARAIDDSNFWTAVCKFEQRNFRVAVDALERYRTQNPQGAWTRQSRYLLALSLAAQEDYQAAVEELDAVEADDPEYFGYQWLIRQWQMAEPEETAPAE